MLTIRWTSSTARSARRAPTPTAPSVAARAAGQDGCRASANFWAVSQAVSMRRLNVNGGFSLMDYCTAGPQYASGGFIADSRLPAVTNGSQQQWLTRNSEIGPWSNGVWNQVFAGVVGAPDRALGQEQGAGGEHRCQPLGDADVEAVHRGLVQAVLMGERRRSIVDGGPGFDLFAFAKGKGDCFRHLNIFWGAVE